MQAAPTTPLRVYLIVRAATRPGEKDVLEESNTTVPGLEDVAKTEAASRLRAQGYAIRSLSWSPVPGSARPMLVAYVSPSNTTEPK